MGFRPLPKKNIKLIPKRVNNHNINIPNPFEAFIKRLNSSLSKITAQKPLKDDYNSIIRSYLPENAKILTPQYPVHTNNFQFADLDGDSKNELITSYKVNDKITTMVLKKQNSRWEKAAEITNANYDSINFMGFADVQGMGQNQLLIGYNNSNGSGELHGYSVHAGNANKLFTENYSRIEVLQSSNNRTPTKAQLAIWNALDKNRHNIDVKHWNGANLESVTDQSSYYRRNILPYYTRKVKQMPTDPANWYNLAEALTKAGMFDDGIHAVEFGLRNNPSSPSKEDFIALKEKIIQKRTHS